MAKSVRHLFTNNWCSYLPFASGVFVIWCCHRFNASKECWKHVIASGAGDTRNLAFRSHRMTAQDVAPCNDMISTLCGSAMCPTECNLSQSQRKTSRYRQYRFHTGWNGMELEANCCKIIYPSAVSLSSPCVVCPAVSYTAYTCLPFHRQGAIAWRPVEYREKGNLLYILIRRQWFFGMYFISLPLSLSLFFRNHPPAREKCFQSSSFLLWKWEPALGDSTSSSLFFFCFSSDDPEHRPPVVPQHMSGHYNIIDFPSSRKDRPLYTSLYGCVTVHLYVCSVMLSSHRPSRRKRDRHM